jgi:hypothetical protein
MASRSLKSNIETKIQRSCRNVFLRRDFGRLGGYDQVGRALRTLVAEGKLMKIGYGLYAKARPNRLTGQPMLTVDGGFSEIAQEALKRLRIKWKATDTTSTDQTDSTQIPVNAEVIVFDRFNRKIGNDRFRLRIIKV